MRDLPGGPGVAKVVAMLTSPARAMSLGGPCVSSMPVAGGQRPASSAYAVQSGRGRGGPGREL